MEHSNSSDDDVNLAEYLKQRKVGKTPSDAARGSLDSVTAQQANSDLCEQSDLQESTSQFLNGFNRKVCIICMQRDIVRDNKPMVCLRGSTLSKSVLTVYAKRQRDYALLIRLSANTIIWIHTFCWIRYSKKTHKSPYNFRCTEKNNNRTELHVVRGLHKIAYAAVCELIHEQIIGNERIITMHDLNLQYRIILYTLNEDDPQSLYNYKCYDLNKKLLEDFPGMLVIEKCSKTKEDILHKVGVDAATAQQVPTNVSWTYKQIKQALETKQF